MHVCPQFPWVKSNRMPPFLITQGSDLSPNPDPHCLSLPQVKSNGMLLLDPGAAEEARCEGSCIMALMPSCNEVTQLSMQGEWDFPSKPYALRYGGSPLAAFRPPSLYAQQPYGTRYMQILGSTTVPPFYNPTTECRVLGRGRGTRGAGAVHGRMHAAARDHAGGAGAGR